MPSFLECPASHCSKQFFDAGNLRAHVRGCHPDLLEGEGEDPPQGSTTDALEEPTPVSAVPMADAEEEPGVGQDPPPGPPAPSYVPRHDQHLNPEDHPMKPCPYCGREFQHAKRLENHIVKDHPDSETAADINRQRDAAVLDQVKREATKPKRVRKAKATITDPAKSRAEKAIDKLHEDRLARARLRASEAEANGEGPWILVVEVEGGVSIRLHAESQMAYELACAAADRHGIPFH